MVPSLLPYRQVGRQVDELIGRQVDKLIGRQIDR